MHTSTGITELRSSLTATLERVKAGESIVITERGEAIARLVPIEAEGERMARLIRTGVLRAPLQPMDVEAFLKLPRMEDPEGLLVKAVLEERGSTRL
jgi:prevent-host-death family protein